MPYDEKTGWLRSKVTATAHAGTRFAHSKVYDDWTHEWRQEGSQLVIDVNSGHGGPARFRLQMLDEEAATKALELIEKHKEIDITYLQPNEDEKYL